jgi:hypothetical protein
MIMIFYSFGVNSSGKFGCRISIDNTAQPQSTFITHNSPDGTAFGWVILFNIIKLFNILILYNNFDYI